MTEQIDPSILGVLRRASQQIRDLRIRAQAIEDFANAEAIPLNIGPGDSVDLDAGTITRAKAPE